MKTIVIPQFYRGPSGQKGLYNRQEVGLARAFAALGCRAVVLYPAPGAKAPRIETPEPNVKICYMPAVAFGVQAFYKSWQILLDEHADAVHVMGDNSLGVPGLYRFCQKHGILFYSQLGALKSTSNHAAVRRVMDLLLRRNLAVYRKTPTYAKTPAVAAELESLGVPCAGLMPVGLDTAIIPSIPNNRTEIRRALKIDEHARVFIFVGRLDPYKQPLDLVPLLQAAPDWYAIIIGRGSLGDELTRRLTDAGLLDRCRLIPQLPNEQVHVYYHACDAFVNLNPNEIFGMSLLEAMYAGCPPVARHAPGPDLIIENGISGNDLARDLLESGQPFLFGRCGATEMRTVADWLQNGGHNFTDRTRADIRNLSGVFPTDDATLDKFCRLYVKTAQSAELLALWNVGAEREVIRGCDATRFTELRALEPYYHARPWSAALAGKRVLVVHPFRRTILAQYEKRTQLFPGKDVLPELACLTVIQAVQGLGGQDTGYADWFDALTEMERRMDAADYDVAIVGAGAYSLPLAAHARDTGHAAIQMSGATQLLFGIKGKRWDDHPVISKLYNPAWVRPDETEGISNKEKVEGGSYW